MNLVRAGLVEKPEEYLLSSCGGFYGVQKGLLELAFLRSRIANPLYLWFGIGNVEQRGRWVAAHLILLKRWLVCSFTFLFYCCTVVF